MANSSSILVLNVGSSSLKFALFAADHPPAADTLLCDGEFAGIGHRPHFSARHAQQVVADELLAPSADQNAVLERLLEFLKEREPDRDLIAAVHRIVHGGRKYSATVRVTEQVHGDLEQLVPLDPAHMPPALAAIATLTRTHPRLVQIACFDTAFHRSQSATARAFALPRRWMEEGIERFGFHGLSYEYVAGALPAIMGRAATRVIVAHLGSGASLCALRDGRSIATTMSFTPLDGLPMGRRCGSLDPGVVLYLLREKGLSASELTRILYEESGLLGVSGISDDMRELLDSTDAHAAAAVDLFVYRIGLEVGALTAALRGLDALVFTGGIGEHASVIRERVCTDAAWLGIDLDATANAAGRGCITRPGSAVSAWVVATHEELMMARHAWNTLRGD